MNCVIVALSLCATLAYGAAVATETSSTTPAPISDLKKLFETNKAIFVAAETALKTPAKTADWFKDIKAQSTIKQDKVLQAAKAFVAVKLSASSEKLSALDSAITKFNAEVGGDSATLANAATQQKISEAYSNLVVALSAVVAEGQGSRSTYIIYILVGVAVFAVVALLLFCQCRKRSNV